MTGENPVDFVIRLFRERGDAAYFGESVSQTEHALQSAWAAELAGAGQALIAAALLHDIGHLLHELPEECAEYGIDDAHERLGAAWLSRHFGEAVIEPVRLHVPAKRFLCATDPSYAGQLSEASLLSLKLQGGPYTADEAAQFRLLPGAEAAVKLRQIDDQAKVPDLPTPNLEYFRCCLEAVYAARRNQDSPSDI
jgi:phosphonate degradation associated HDIG domain protein